MKKVVTHKKPDADALVATWLAERYLFHGEPVEVLFVSRSLQFSTVAADCIVDVSNTYNAQQLIFDHKPPGFADRNETCATKLIWKYLLSIGWPIQHLKALVEVVHEGDCNPPRKPSRELEKSRADGLHAYVASQRRICNTDRGLYEVVRLWLDKYAATARNQMNHGQLQ